VNKGRDKDTIDRKAKLILVEMKEVKGRETLHTYLGKTDWLRRSCLSLFLRGSFSRIHLRVLIHMETSLVDAASE